MGFSDWTGRIRLFSVFRVASLSTGSSRWRRRSPSGRQLAASVGFSGTHLEQVCRPAHNSGERNTPGAHIWRNTGSPRSEHPKHRLPWRSRISSSPRKSSVGARPDLSFRKQQRLTGAVGSAAGGRAIDGSGRSRHPGRKRSFRKNPPVRRRARRNADFCSPFPANRRISQAFPSGEASRLSGRVGERDASSDSFCPDHLRKRS